MSSLLTSTSSDIALANFLVDIGAALVIGVFLAFVYAIRTRCTRSFLVTLVMLPAVVAVVIMMVNGSIGAGIAVAGAFSLVRFRSVPGTAKEIAAIFLAMTAGLACGMGQVLYAFLFSLLLGAVMAIAGILLANEEKKNARILTVMIPEDLDYTGIFDDLFTAYAKSYTLLKVKTTNMGSMLKLTYEVQLKSSVSERDFLNDLRCRNGNLEISLARPVESYNEL